MHYVKAKGIFTSDYGINLYRGCTHGCIYCDSRSDIYQLNHKFEDIEVKENAVELLKRELIRRKPFMVVTGAMTDPYVPIEEIKACTKMFGSDLQVWIRFFMPYKIGFDSSGFGSA